MGEYDPATGLTHITHQRGRLLFNMGASSKKQQRKGRSVSTSSKTMPTSIGTFTGLSLYPEEANYLLRRGALIIYLMPRDGEDAHELSIAAFTAMLVKNAHVSLACIEAYAFLKEKKLHPRRCLKPLTETLNHEGCRSIPGHWSNGEHCDIAFEVWKTVLLNVEPSKLNESTLLKPRKQTKSLELVFRVVVCRFGDAAPTPHSLRLVAESRKARDSLNVRPCIQVPVKVAVVHHDNSVVLFEISAAPATDSTSAICLLKK